MERIKSLQNAKVKNLVRLHQKKYRDETGLFLVEGEHLILEARQAGILQYVITDEEDCPYDNILLVTSEIMKKISANVSAVHYIGVCTKCKIAVKEPERVLLLDDVQDPGNLGTLIRTAVSFSFDAIYCSKHTVDVYNEKVIRSTQGALFYIPVIYSDLTQTIAALKQDGFTIVGTSLHEASAMRTFQNEEKMAFVLGNEGQGVSEQILSLCDKKLFIEMQGFESLNVAVAGGIVMYAFQPHHE